MKKHIVYLLICINALLLVCIYRLNEVHIKEKALLTEQNNKISIENLLLRDDVILSKQGGCSLDSKMLLYAENGDSIQLSKLKRNGVTLVLRYSTLCCSSCVNDILNRMKDFSESNENVDVLLLATYRLMYESSEFRRLSRIFPKVYNVFSLDIPLEKELVPYLFILDEDMRVIDTFIPRKELPELTKFYFGKIKELFKASSSKKG